MTTTIKETKTLEIEVTKDTVKPATVILRNPRDKHVVFTCSHCGAKFSTTDWMRTRGKHYSALCPCCPYRAWAR